MRNIRLEIEYDGTRYQGWQVQAGHKVARSQSRKLKTIQETIERTLQRILQEKVRLIVSGRTDAGVHAQAQVANFKTSSKIPLDKLQLALNGILPEDIAIINIEEKPLRFNSRFDAKSKVYRYSILNRRYPCALSRHTVFFYPYALALKLMQQESKCLLGRHNFKSFQASDKMERSPVKTIKKINITKNKEGLINIDIEAGGFAYNMVRNIVGTLIEIGRKRFKKGDLKKILLAKNRKSAGPTAPAKGLTLLKVNY